MIHYCGSPQGRRPEETGVHGCTLVQVDAQRQTRTTLIPTDAVRWLNERIAVDETTTREDLETRLRDRVHALQEAAPASALLISWTIAGRGPLAAQLRRTKLAAELLDWLRSDYGHRSPAAWSVSLEVEVSETLPPEWYEQETIRGDFLRAVRQLQMNPEEPLGIGFLPGRVASGRHAGRGGGRGRQGGPRSRAARGGGPGRRPVERRGVPHMRITDLEIDGFGVWSGLRIEKLAEGLNVLYGPNEAGKTTLLAVYPLDALWFLAASDADTFRRSTAGGRAECIDVAGPNGRFADQPPRRLAARRHARRASHAHRPRRHPSGRTFREGALVERR